MKKSIGILGGMGPLATADLFQKIISLTAAASDNEHIRVYIDSNSSIPDRTEAILSGGPDPLPAMRDSLRKLEACGADCVVMPCNTAHYFLPRLQGLTDIPFLSMLEAAPAAPASPGKPPPCWPPGAPCPPGCIRRPWRRRASPAFCRGRRSGTR